MNNIKKLLSLLLVVMMLSAAAIAPSEAAEEIIVRFHTSVGSSDDVFKSVSASRGGSVAETYELPKEAGKAFAGWYYDEDFTNAFSFSDTLSDNTELYARWIDAEGFELEGVQLRAQGGMRYLTTLSNSLLAELDGLSENTVGANQSRVEYGFIATKESNITSWLSFAGEHLDAQTYELGYNGTNVNGVDTTKYNAAYQGFVKDIDCTAGDYSESDIEDYENNDDSRVYTFAVTYDDSADKLADRIAARSYLRYYDANGLLRTLYNSYAGTDAYGGCSSSYDDVIYISENTGYYRSVAEMAADADNLTVENGTASTAGAECSMYISGGKAYMKLLRNAECGDISLNVPADLNLMDNTLSFNAGALQTSDSFRMYNGTYEASDADTFSVHKGGFTKIRNVSFKADCKKSFKGLRLYDSSYIYQCDFDIKMDNTSAICAATIANSGDVTVNECDYSLVTNADQSFAVRSQDGSLLLKNSAIDSRDLNGEGRTIVDVFCINENVTVDNCDLSVKTNTNAMLCYLKSSENSVVANSSLSAEGLSDNTICYGVYGFETNKSTAVKDSSISLNGDFQAINGIIFHDYEDVEKGGDFTLENTSVDMYLDAAQNDDNWFCGLDLGNDMTADINGYKCSIDTSPTGNAAVFGAYLSGTVKADINGCDIRFATHSDSGSEWNWLGMNGLRIVRNADVSLTNADIRIPAYNDMSAGNDPPTYNSGILLSGNGKLAVSEDGGSVYVAGGNAGINTGGDSELTVSGGKFCSPTHGGAYIGGKSAEITGGEFFAVYTPGFTPHGAMYVTFNAVVNIDGAKLYGGYNGIRTRANTKTDASGNTVTVECNPVVNVSHCEITAVWDNCHLSNSVGTINDDGTNTFLKGSGY